MAAPSRVWPPRATAGRRGIAMHRVQWFWSVQAIDLVVFGVMVIVPLGLLAWVLVTHVGRGQRIAFVVTESMVITFVGLLAVYVAYASLRTQTRQAAEIALDSDADDLFAYEMAEAPIRCLYDNYGWDAPDACRARIAGDPQTWTKTLYYVEETLFILKKARRDRLQWGSGYGREIAYWQADVSKDPTGLFSYFLVNGADDLAEAKAEMREAGLCMPNLCNGYRQVVAALGEHRDHKRPVACATAAAIASAAVRCKPEP
ncbi:MAG: hypothetical protein ABW042_07055 [Phenylobacterium sp.]